MRYDLGFDPSYKFDDVSCEELGDENDAPTFETRKIEATTPPAPLDPSDPFADR